MADPTKSELQRHLEGEMRVLRERFEKFENEANEIREKAEADMRRQYEDMKGRNAEMEAKLDELRRAGEDVFETMGRNIEAGMKDFAAAIDNVFPSDNRPTTKTKNEDTPQS